MSSSSCDIAIVGNGISGITAAHHAVLGGASVVLFHGEEDLPGGLAANVGELEGFPVASTIGGMQLAEKIAEVAAQLGLRVFPSRVQSIEKGAGGFILNAGLKRWSAKQVIIASGARLKMIDIPGIEKFRERGILQCAWCNAGLYRGRDVVVIGGGNSAVQESLHLSKYASTVTIVTRGDELRAQRSSVLKAANIDRIQFRWNSEPVEIFGDDVLERLRVRNQVTNVTEDLSCAGIFVFVGLEPNAECGRQLVEKDTKGFILTDSNFETLTSGLFAIGAVRSRYDGRWTNAVGEATTAAIRAVQGVRRH